MMKRIGLVAVMGFLIGPAFVTGAMAKNLSVGDVIIINDMPPAVIEFARDNNIPISNKCRVTNIRVSGKPDCALLP